MVQPGWSSNKRTTNKALVRLFVGAVRSRTFVRCSFVDKAGSSCVGLRGIVAM